MVGHKVRVRTTSVIFWLIMSHAVAEVRVWSICGMMIGSAIICITNPSCYPWFT
jgi:hypothetical protein